MKLNRILTNELGYEMEKSDLIRFEPARVGHYARRFIFMNSSVRLTPDTL